MKMPRWLRLPRTVRGWFALLCGLWLGLAVSLLVLAWGPGVVRLSWLFALYLLLTAVASLVAFVAFGIDKRRASSGGRRISENYLHLFALAGGWPGAVVGQAAFRHKTQKLSFRLVLGLIICLHVALLVFWTYHGL